MDKFDPAMFAKKKATLPEPPAKKLGLPDPPEKKATLPEPPAKKLGLPEPPVKKGLPDPPEKKATLPEPPAKKMGLPDHPEKKATLPEPPAKKLDLPEPPVKKVGLLEPPEKKAGLPEPPAKKLGLPDPPAKKGGLPDPPEKKTTLPDPPAKKAGLPEPPEKKAGLPDPPEKKATLPDPPVKKAGLPEPPDKKAGLPEPPEKKAGLPEPPEKKAGLPEPPEKKAGLPEPPEKKAEPEKKKERVLPETKEEPPPAQEKKVEQPAPKEEQKVELPTPKQEEKVEPPVVEQEQKVEPPAVEQDKKVEEPPKQEKKEVSFAPQEKKEPLEKKMPEAQEEEKEKSEVPEEVEVENQSVKTTEKEKFEIDDKKTELPKSTPSDQSSYKPYDTISYSSKDDKSYEKDKNTPSYERYAPKTTPPAPIKSTTEPTFAPTTVRYGNNLSDTEYRYKFDDSWKKSTTDYQNQPTKSAVSLPKYRSSEDIMRDVRSDPKPYAAPTVPYTPVVPSSFKSQYTRLEPNSRYDIPPYRPPVIREPLPVHFPERPSLAYSPYRSEVDSITDSNTDSLQAEIHHQNIRPYYPSERLRAEQLLSPRSEASREVIEDGLSFRPSNEELFLRPRPLISSAAPSVIVHPTTFPLSQPHHHHRDLSPRQSGRPKSPKSVSWNDQHRYENPYADSKSSREVLSEIRARWQLDSNEEQERRLRTQEENKRRREAETELMEECEELSSTLQQKQMEVQNLSRELDYLRSENQNMQQEMNRALEKGDLRTHELMQVIEEDREMLEQTRKENNQLRSKIEADERDILKLEDRIVRLEKQLGYLQGENAELAEKLNETADHIRSSVVEYRKPVHEENDNLKRQLSTIESELTELRREIAIQKQKNATPRDGRNFQFPSRSIGSTESRPLVETVHEQVMSKANNLLQRLDEPREVSDAWFNKTQTFSSAGYALDDRIPEDVRYSRADSMSPPRSTSSRHEDRYDSMSHQQRVASNEFLLVPSPRRPEPDKSQGHVSRELYRTQPTRPQQHRSPEDEEISNRVRDFLSRIRKKDEEELREAQAQAQQELDKDCDQEQPGIFERINGRISEHEINETLHVQSQPEPPKKIVPIPQPPWQRKTETREPPPRRKLEDYLRSDSGSPAHSKPSSFVSFGHRDDNETRKKLPFGSPAPGKNSRLLSQLRARAKRNSALSIEEEEIKKTVDSGREALQRIKDRYKDTSSSTLMPARTVSAMPTFQAHSQPNWQANEDLDQRRRVAGLLDHQKPTGMSLKDRLSRYKSTESLISSVSSYRNLFDNGNSQRRPDSGSNQVPRLNLDTLSIFQDPEYL